MDSMGMGLVFTAVDNASATINKITQSFDQLGGVASRMEMQTNPALNAITAMGVAGHSMSIVGDMVGGAGSKIVSAYVGVTQKVIETGQQMLNWNMQLNAMYGANAKKVLNNIMDYAQNSIFEIKDLIPAVTMMKAVGIEAMDEVTTSSGKGRQKLMDYAADLAAMVPQMRNMYGTGVQAAMGAIKEYVAEGNALSLKRGAGMDIEGILGVKKGGDIKTRTQQVADLIEKLNILGYTAKMNGTPMQMISNIHDAFFRVLTQITESGVFDAYTKLLKRVYDYLFKLANDEGKMKRLTDALGKAIVAIITPLEKLVDLLIPFMDAVVNFITENPKLTTMLIVIGAIVGVSLSLVGTILQLAGAFFMLASGVMMFTYFTGAGSILFGAIGSAIAAAIPWVLAIIAVIGLLAYAWKNDLGGIHQIANDIGVALQSLWNGVTLFWKAVTGQGFSRQDMSLMQNLGIKDAVDAIVRLKNTVLNFWTQVVFPYAKMIWSSMQPLLGFFGKIGMVLIDIAGMTVSLFGGIAILVLEGLNLIITFLTGVFTGDFTSFVGNLTRIFDTIFSKIKDTVKSVFDYILGRFPILNTIAEKIKSIIPSETTTPASEPPATPAVEPATASTGGETGDNEGLVYLHRNEFVANSELTSGLRALLGNISSQRPAPSESVPAVATSVTFEQGSIVIQANSGNDADLEAMAEELMRKIARKIEIRNMSQRGGGSYVLT